jgi:hypothetical protein
MLTFKFLFLMLIGKNILQDFLKQKKINKIFKTIKEIKINFRSNI